MPRREAVARSMTRRVWSPWSCSSLGHVTEHRQRLELLHEAWNPAGELARVGIFEAVLKLSPAYPVFHRQILHGLHEERDPLDPDELWLQAANDVAGADPPHLDGF